MVQRRPVSEPELPPQERSFRLRHLLLVAAMAALGWWSVPRARAAFELHSLATAAADYGVCMVGPTGASTLRDNPQGFAALVRRRLVDAQPGAYPFADCAALSREVSGSVEVERAHTGRADDFFEYGGANTAHHSLAELSFGLTSLARVAKAAWPLERRGYAHLMNPSSHAKEAPHPVAPNAPATGRGLPGWRSPYASGFSAAGSRFLAVGHASNLEGYESKDGGVNWHPVSLAAPGMAKHAGRCVAADSDHGFVIEFTESGAVIQSLVGDNPVSETRIDAVTEVLATSCDQEGMSIAVERQEQRELLLCAHAGRCGQLPHRPEWLRGHFDVARVAGATVIATARAGIVRVRSSRDRGQSWTPDTVAFDWAAQVPTAEIRVPSRLLAIGKELWLYGAARPGQTYPLLFSVDMGASWYAPRSLVVGAELSASR
jgi:hypothetical protein